VESVDDDIAGFCYSRTVRALLDENATVSA
jgi:hypothetical protein